MSSGVGPLPAKSCRSVRAPRSARSGPVESITSYSATDPKPPRDDAYRLLTGLAWPDDLPLEMVMTLEASRQAEGSEALRFGLFVEFLGAVDDCEGDLGLVVV